MKMPFDCRRQGKGIFIEINKFFLGSSLRLARSAFAANPFIFCHGWPLDYIPMHTQNAGQTRKMASTNRFSLMYQTILSNE